MGEGVTTVPVKLGGGRDYDIAIGAGVLAGINKVIAGRRVLTICDDGAKHHLPDALSKPVLYLPPGEGSKSFAALEKTLDWILSQKPDRKTIIIAFGGGVTGDHAGFAAAITLRGLDYIQVPTTLLAQVDSSVGGKTGINAKQGKNLIGAFHQPKAVLADINVLASLPDRQMRAGYAEIVKYAFIGNAPFFAWLEDNGAKVLAREPAALTHAIATSCDAKAKIVVLDEKESGARALLNFGHTFAHALEAACGYDRTILHGEAVGIGMALAFDTSLRMGLCEDAHFAIDHMKRLGLPVRIADIDGFPTVTPDKLIDLMAGDKKMANGKLTFILSRGIGAAFVTQDVDMNAVRAALASSLERG